MTHRAVRITFHRCYRVSSQMYWGVDCISDGEMIGSASWAESGDLIDEVRETWEDLVGDLSLFQGELVMASTNSKLELVAGGLTVEPAAADRVDPVPQ